MNMLLIQHCRSDGSEMISSFFLTCSALCGLFYKDLLEIATLLYGGPQVQSENLNIPVQKNKYQHENIYFSTKKYISIQKYLLQYQNIHVNPKIFISVQKMFSKKYKHIPSVFATRQQKGSESFKMADLNGY